MMRLPNIGVPFLALLGLEVEAIGWGTLPEDVEPNLPPGGRLVTMEGTGHFVHVEQPRFVADQILEHLA
jgi:pimeloyl-ACP methyl ester carboxylesterase